MRISDIETYMKDRTVGAVEGAKYFSVLIPLVEREDGLHILFERRSSKLKAQPGDVCFPGGKIEKGESIIDCALRETWEEIGIPPEKIRVLGQFDSLFEISNITLHTVVGVIDETSLQHLHINEAEVAQVFTVPFDFFTESKPLVYEYDIVQKVDDFPYEEAGVSRSYKWRVGKKSIPVFHYGEGDNRQIIWGMTGRIVTWFVSQMTGMAENI